MVGLVNVGQQECTGAQNLDRYNVHGQVEFARARCDEKHAEYDKETECLNEEPSVMK